MALMPKRVKHRKSQRGRIRGNATRANRVAFGEFGLQSEEGGWLSAQEALAWGSRSTTRTLWPAAWAAEAKPRVTVVLPTPPFWFNTAAMVIAATAA